MFYVLMIATLLSQGLLLALKRLATRFCSCGYDQKSYKADSFKIMLLNPVCEVIFCSVIHYSC